MAGAYSDESMTQLESIEALVGKHAERLGVDPLTALDNALKFADVVGTLENDGKLQGKNPKSTAKGLYQFIDGSVAPAINRITKYLPEEDWMKEAKTHKDANRLSWNQQTLMLLGDLLEKKGSDESMREVLQSGDTASMRDAYYKLHHTAPDEATKRRTEGILDGTIY